MIKRHVLKLAGILLTSLFVGQAAYAVDFNAYNHNSSTGNRQTRWMSNLSDGTRLASLSIPGTHDSMARYGGDIAQTQSLPLSAQLVAGVRALDIRCRHYYNACAIHHGPIYQYAGLDDVLSTVRDFLALNPRETVLMRIQEEYTPAGNTRSFESTFIEYKNRYSNLFWSFNSYNPTLGEVRGKVVLLQNFSANSSYGIPWSSLNIQDNYNLSSNFALYGKWQSVKNQLSNATYGSSSTIYANFLSGSGGVFPYFVASGSSFSSNGQPLLILKTGSTNRSEYADFPRTGCFGFFCSIQFEGTNRLTSDYLGNYRRVGIVFADFPGDSLINKIIGKN